MPGETWAKVPRSVIESGLSNGAIRLYIYLDLTQGDRGRPAKGYAAVGQKINMKRQTVSRHSRELVKAGLVEEIEERPDPPTSGRPAVTMRVIHNPARKKENPSAQVRPPTPRSKPASVYSSPKRTFIGGNYGRSMDEFVTNQGEECGPRNGLRPRSSRSEVGVREQPVQRSESTIEKETNEHAAGCSECGGLVVRTPDGPRNEFCSCPF